MHQAKLVASDDMITRAGFEKVHELLLGSPTGGPQAAGMSNSAPRPHVCIVGGSHSALSAAWLCLKILEDSSQPPPQPQSHPAAASAEVVSKLPLVPEKGKASCPTSPPRVAVLQLPKISGLASPPEPLTSPTPLPASSLAAPKPSSPSRIASSPTGRRRPQSTPTPPPMSTASITVLHRSPFRLFYASKREAEDDGQKSWKFVNRRGQINPFGGLRGDAKELFAQIRDGDEPRVRLVMVRPGGSQAIVEKAYDRAAVIIWACGYEANSTELLDAQGEKIELCRSRGQVDVDSKGRMMRLAGTGDNGEGAFLENVFAVGLGFGLPASSDEDGTSASAGRADGVSIYLKHSASLVIAAVLSPDVVFGPGALTWKDRQELNERHAEKLAAASKTTETQATSMLRLCQPHSPKYRGMAPTNPPVKRVDRRNSTTSPKKAMKVPATKDNEGACLHSPAVTPDADGEAGEAGGGAGSGTASADIREVGAEDPVGAILGPPEKGRLERSLKATAAPPVSALHVAHSQMKASPTRKVRAAQKPRLRGLALAGTRERPGVGKPQSGR